MLIITILLIYNIGSEPESHFRAPEPESHFRAPDWLQPNSTVGAL